MQTQILKPLPQVLFIDSARIQDIEFLLPETNEYHTVKLISKQYNYKNNELLTVEDKVPIVVTFKPNTRLAEISCKRYFISRLIEKIKLHLVRKYHFYFSIKSVQELHLNIIREIDVFDSNISTFTINAKLVVEYFKSGKKYNTEDSYFTEEFVFSSCSLLGDIVLDTSTTLPPDTWNCIKDFISIPRGTTYSFNDNTIQFKYRNKDYYWNIENKQLSW
jgi:hypothetical protein